MKDMLPHELALETPQPPYIFLCLHEQLQDINFSRQPDPELNNTNFSRDPQILR
jgi:hypothetical protein